MTTERTEVTIRYAITRLVASLRDYVADPTFSRSLIGQWSSSVEQGDEMHGSHLEAAARIADALEAATDTEAVRIIDEERGRLSNMGVLGPWADVAYRLSFGRTRYVIEGGVLAECVV